MTFLSPFAHDRMHLWLSMVENLSRASLPASLVSAEGLLVCRQEISTFQVLSPSLAEEAGMTRW